MDKLRVGIIGVGWPGQRHIEGYQKHPGAEIVALSDVNTEAAEQVKAEYGVNGARIYGDYQEMLASDVDAVSVCTPNFLHAPMAIDALEAGKHVLLEKPLAHTLEDGERLAAKVAESPDLAFMIAFNNRYRPDSLVLKERIDDGTLGEIYYAKTGWLRSASGFFLRGWFTQKDRSGGGPLIDLGVHMLDLSLWFMGNPRPASVSGSVYHKFRDYMQESVGGTVDVEDLATALVKLDNGATIVLDVSWLSHIEQGDLVYSQLFGTEGGAKIERGGGQEDLRIYTVGGSGASRTTMVGSPKFNSWGQQQHGFMLYESFRGEIADFVDSIKDGRQPGATITHGLDILRVLDAIYRSAETGREIDLHEAPPTDTEHTPGHALATHR
ncbi:MAG: Gfo/Idh/MocA family oxidoreductase [Chloroflexota bacterium]|nr:Gfo/Idh/MocA family oxidoreductase [Chloroflexota bacterium]